MAQKPKTLVEINKEDWYVVVVRGEDDWYANALVENSFDAVAVARFYQDTLGYVVRLWKNGKDVSHLFLNANFGVVEEE